jgi:hypothetical protein
MKSAVVSRFVIVAAVVLMSTPLFAQISFTDFSSTSGLTLNGSAVQAGNVLRLTSDGTNHVTGTAWFSPRQPVTGSFSTTFSFRITHASQPADGIAFVIQNTTNDDSGLSAVGGSGGAIGYGAPDPGDVGSPIPNSLAIEFDTYQNGWDPDANHVAVQSCGTVANSQVHTTPGTGCTIGLASVPPSQTTLADGGVHTATITFAPPPSGTGPGLLDVILDNHDLFPGGLSFNWSTLSLTNGTSAFVGFTGSTGGSTETNDILSWTFTPQAQSAPVTTNTAAVLSFDGGPANNAYNYNAILTAGGVTSATVTIKPILIDEEACEKLVDANPKFGKAQCFVYQNAGKDSGGNSVDSAVLFELTCPDQPGGTCGDTGPANFFATLGSDFTFSKAENPGFQFLNSTIGPYPGWLKGSGLDPLHPCTPNPDGVTPLFASNQITSFIVSGDPLGTTRGTSGGGGSCWVATYATSGELPPGIKITTPTFTTYKLNQSVAASYACSDPKTSKNSTTSPVGPYLVAASCRQSQSPNLHNTSSCGPNTSGVISCTGGVDTSVKGLHLFTVTSKDSGGNVNANLVIYNVK